jgi:hypothetical protein
LATPAQAGGRSMHSQIRNFVILVVIAAVILVVLGILIEASGGLPQ